MSIRKRVGSYLFTCSVALVCFASADPYLGKLFVYILPRRPLSQRISLVQFLKQGNPLPTLCSQFSHQNLLKKKLDYF